METDHHVIVLVLLLYCTKNISVFVRLEQHNDPFSYRLLRTGSDIQTRLFGRSLDCKLVPVHYQKHERGLANGLLCG